jgi:ferredoxin
MLRVVMVVRCAGRKVCLVAAEERFRAKEERRVVWQRRGAINIWRCGGQGWCDYGDRAFEKDKRQRLDYWTRLLQYSRGVRGYGCVGWLRRGM